MSETTTVHGHFDDRFKAVRDALEQNLSNGTELGASIAVEIDGEPVLDLWGGHRDTDRTLPWESDTITTVFSITKIASAMAILELAGRGELDLNAPVVKYWPEFATDTVLVRHLLAHTAGYPGFNAPSSVEDLWDARAAADRLAAQTPWWEPGTQSGYHLITQGFLLGELVRRQSGKSLRDFVATDIAGPLGADFQIGANEHDWDRIARVVAPPMLFDVSSLDPESVRFRAFTGPVVPPETADSPQWRRAEVGAVNGHGNARSVARLLSGLLDDERVFDQQSDDVDVVNGLHVRWGLGLAISDARTLDWIPEGRIAYWGGTGGSMAIVDSDRHMTIGYVMNKMAPGILGSLRAKEYISEIYKAVG